MKETGLREYVDYGIWRYGVSGIFVLVATFPMEYICAPLLTGGCDKKPTKI
jgi:hypothetical protein